MKLDLPWGGRKARSLLLERKAGSSYRVRLIEEWPRFMPLAHLTDRSVISIGGEDAADFLAGLVTCEVPDADKAHFGALLTPQGKIISDFFLLPRNDGELGFLVDAPKLVAETLLKRLTMYKLRAKVTLADLSAEKSVFAAWGGTSALAGSASFTDPRFAEMGLRCVATSAGSAPASDASLADYDAHRIGLAMPQGGRDFAYGDAFPHEAAMDQLAGVDFQKGCYVGQEVVSRMQHRGTARTRIAALRSAGAAPQEGAEVKAGEKTLGRVGSVDAASGRAIGLLRLDRLAEAFTAKEELRAGAAALRAERPVWARYHFPVEAEGETR
jgi:folate-binding protein YgfZ